MVQQQSASCRDHRSRPSSLQVGAHSRHLSIGVLPGQLELDVGIERLEALLAAELRLSWPGQALSQAPGVI